MGLYVAGERPTVLMFVADEQMGAAELARCEDWPRRFYTRMLWHARPQAARPVYPDIRRAQPCSRFMYN